MGVYTRSDSPFYQLWLEGAGPDGKGLKEPTDIRHDAPLAAQRRENRHLADIRYHDRMSEIAKGHADGGKPSRTFAEHAAWFTRHKLPHRKGRDREARVIPKLVAVFGRYPLKQLTRTLVTERWVTPRLTTPTVITKGARTAPRRVQAGPRTVNREVELLKSILSSAIPDYIEASPLFGMPQLKTMTPKRRLMTPAEEKQLLAVMDVDDRALFLLALDSLIRLTDVLDLKRTDDHRDRMWIADPKAGGGFEVPISARARRALDAWSARRGKDDDPYLFPRRRVAATERDRRCNIAKVLARYCAKTTPPIPYGRRVGGITFHWATRRTGATRMLTRGVDLGTTQKVGRWKTPTVVLGIYHELLDEHAHRAVNIVGPERELSGSGWRPKQTRPEYNRQASTPRRSSKTSPISRGTHAKTRR